MSAGDAKLILSLIKHLLDDVPGVFDMEVPEDAPTQKPAEGEDRCAFKS